MQQQMMIMFALVALVCIGAFVYEAFRGKIKLIHILLLPSFTVLLLGALPKWSNAPSMITRYVLLSIPVLLTLFYILHTEGKLSIDIVVVASILFLWTSPLLGEFSVQKILDKIIRLNDTGREVQNKNRSRSAQESSYYRRENSQTLGSKRS